MGLFGPKKAETVPQVYLNCNAETAKAQLLSKMLALGFSLEEDTTYKLAFAQEFKGAATQVLNAWAGGAAAPVRRIYTFVLAPMSNGQTLVTATAENLRPSAQGSYQRFRLDLHEQLSKWLSELRMVCG